MLLALSKYTYVKLVYCYQSVTPRRAPPPRPTRGARISARAAGRGVAGGAWGWSGPLSQAGGVERVVKISKPRGSWPAVSPSHRTTVVRKNLMWPELPAGAARARPRCRFAPPLTHLMPCCYHWSIASIGECCPESRTHSVPLFLKRQCDRTLGAALGGDPGWAHAGARPGSSLPDVFGGGRGRGGGGGMQHDTDYAKLPPLGGAVFDNPNGLPRYT
jgi:hypothetical protein